MKKHLSSFLFGCLGLGVGFTLCYVYLVLPQRVASVRTQPHIAVLPMDARAYDWKPYVIQPMIPPRVLGK